MRIAVFMLIALSMCPRGTWAAGLSLKAPKFVLTNGLTVLVLEDHLTPAIAIQLGFRAGSRDEANGQSEFAHLFEHLMNGPSRNDKFQRGESLRKIGGLFINASTFADYTIYYA